MGPRTLERHLSRFSRLQDFCNLSATAYINYKGTLGEYFHEESGCTMVRLGMKEFYENISRTHLFKAVCLVMDALGFTIDCQVSS